MTNAPRKRFGVQSNQQNKPVEFDIADDKGEFLGTFHATRKPRFDVMQAMAAAVDLNTDGHRVFNVDILAYALRESLVTELWSDDHQKWVPADDRQRFNDILLSDRYNVPIETLGEIVMWLMEETSGHPTGAPNPSTDGRSTTTTISMEPPSPVR